MSELTDHLDRLAQLYRTANNLTNELAALVPLPPGTADEDEAAALANALRRLGCERDPGGPDPAQVAADNLEEGLRGGAPEAARNFRSAVHAVRARLDHLARRGKRPPESVLPHTDFGGAGGLAFGPLNDDGTGPPYAFGSYDALAGGDPLRRVLRAEDCFDLEGDRYVILGRARKDDFGLHAPDYVPLAACVGLTRRVSEPQRKARAEYLAREAARVQERRAAIEEGKPAHVRVLEARVAELEARLKDLAEQGTGTTA